jgi:hypothetical protein
MACSASRDSSIARDAVSADPLRVDRGRQRRLAAAERLTPIRVVVVVEVVAEVVMPKHSARSLGTARLYPLHDSHQARDRTSDQQQYAEADTDGSGIAGGECDVLDSIVAALA